MQSNNKYQKFYKVFDEINLKEEDGYVETHLNKIFNELQQKPKSSAEKSRKEKKDLWFSTVDKYLNSIEYAIDKGNSTTKKMSHAFDNIPEPTSKKFVVRFTIIFVILALIIFFASCTQAQAQIIPSPQDLPLPKDKIIEMNEGKSQFLPKEKEQEHLFIKREKMQIKLKEPGSTTGSIWADSSQPKSLATEYQPTHTSEVITVSIPEDLQFKAPEQANNTPATSNNQKYDPVKSLKFEIVGFEPGGDVFLRGSKNYVSESGEQKNIMIMAKMPQRNLNKFEIDAKDLTQVAVSSTNNGMLSEYSAAGWDLTASRLLSGYAPDLNAGIAALDGQKKELETQQKALKDQQKALTDEADRLKKDRNRLNAETAQAKQLFDAATIMDPPDEEGAGKDGNKKSGGGNNNKQSSNSGGGNTNKSTTNQSNGKK